MREVTTRVVCNYCGQAIEVQEVDGAEWGISFGPSRHSPIQGRVDLCPDCSDIWTRDVSALLGESPLPYKRPKPVVTGRGRVIEPEPEPEPVQDENRCSCGRTFGTRRGLSRHRNGAGH